MENCPTTIEEEYYLTVLPDNFEMVGQDKLSFHVYTLYRNEFSNQTISFSQYTKNIYKKHYNTEDHNFEEIEINDHKGIYIYFSESHRSIVIWDNNDYIFELDGNLSKDTLVDLAKSAKVL